MNKRAIENQENIKDSLTIYGEYCFELGRWRGQVDLEESMDGNMFDAFLGVLHANKTAMPLHTVAVNGDERAVKYKLRSEDWRKGVKNTTENRKKEMLEYLIK